MSPTEWSTMPTGYVCNSLRPSFSPWTVYTLTGETSSPSKTPKVLFLIARNRPSTFLFAGLLVWLVQTMVIDNKRLF